MEIKNWINHKWHIFKINMSYKFPYYEWLQCCHLISRPHWHLVGCGKLSLNWKFGLPIDFKYYNPILSIKSSNVGWKDKYDSPRFEWNPYIAIVFFRKWIIHFSLCFSKDSIEDAKIWESILSYNYYNKNFKELINNESMCNK